MVVRLPELLGANQCALMNEEHLARFLREVGGNGLLSTPVSDLKRPSVAFPQNVSCFPAELRSRPFPQGIELRVRVS